MKANYLPWTMLTTNFNNFEMLGSPWCLLSIDSPNCEQPQNYASVAKVLTRLLTILPSIWCQGV